MKHKILLAALLLGSTFGPVAAQTPGLAGRPRPVIAERAGAPVGAARPATGGDRLDQVLVQDWTGTAWDDSTRTRYTQYDANGRLLVTITEDKPGATWQIRNRRRKSYDAAGRMLTDTLDSYTSGNFRSLSERRYVYTAAGKLDTFLISLRLGTTWRQFSRDFYDYDGQGHLTGVQGQSLLFTTWLNDYLFTYVNDAQGRPITEEYQVADVSGANWLPGSLSTYNYAANDSLSVFEVAVWDTTTLDYETASRSRYHYTANNQLDSVYTETYDPNTVTWHLARLDTYTYDARGNRISQLAQQGTSLASLTNQLQWLYSYTPIAGRPEDQPLLTAPTLVPNPATGFTTLAYELAGPAPVSVEVIDNLGRRVSVPLAATGQSTGHHETHLDLRALPAGLYVARLHVGAAMRQLKLVVQ